MSTIKETPEDLITTVTRFAFKRGAEQMRAKIAASFGTKTLGHDHVMKQEIPPFPDIEVV